MTKLLKDWRDYTRERLSNMLISRRIVLPVPGFIHLCYFSQKPLAGPGMIWVIKNIDGSDAKILTLWMNSIFHLAQVLVNKIEDVWINIHQYALDEYLILDPTKLSKHQKDKLLELYDELKDIEFPSLKEQIMKRYNARQKLDSAILGLMGYSEDEAHDFLDELYYAFTREFEVLEEFMKS